MTRDVLRMERNFFLSWKCNQNLSPSPRVVKTDVASHSSDEDTRVQISHGFSPASGPVNAADFPFDCNRTAIAPSPLQAKAVSNEQVCPISPMPLSRSITSAIKPDIYYKAFRFPVKKLLTRACYLRNEIRGYFSNRIELGNSAFSRMLASFS